MATHVALATSWIPANTKLPFKTPHSLSTQSFSKRIELADFSGLRSSRSVTYTKNAGDQHLLFFHAVAAQMAAKNGNSIPVRGKTVAKLKVAINGFGRIGRNILRSWLGRKDTSLIDIVAINDIGGAKNAFHLLKYDSTLGTLKADMHVLNDTISIDGKLIKVLSDTEPSRLPWTDLGVNLVIEGTGVFIDRAGAEKHIKAGAKKVIITAPAKGTGIPTYVYGVNEKQYKHNWSNDIISNGSSTTNCLAPFLQLIDEEFGIVKGTMTTIHSYTGDQRLLDGTHLDPRRARAAALNIVPIKIEEVKAVSDVIPKLEGKLDGITFRVPTPNVSVVDLVVNVEKKSLVSVENVHNVFRRAADGRLKGILALSEDSLVSSDFKGSCVSATVDASLTMVMGDDMIKVVAWFDNEWAYSQRIVDLADMVARKFNEPEQRGEDTNLEEFCKLNAADEKCKSYEA